MREILFRGKLVYNGAWVYGGFYKEPVDDIKDGKLYIITASLESVGNANEVIPESIGQYTGLTDKNGKKIFEGDIVKTPQEEFIKIWEVIYDNGKFQLFNGLNSMIDIENNKYITKNQSIVNDIEVIGNFNENTELLQE